MTLSKACSQYGADMGRRSTPCPEDFSGTFSALEVFLDDGGYDEGGAYWGRVEGSALWRISAETEEEQVEQWHRAKDFAALQAHIQRAYPLATVVKEIGEDRLNQFVAQYERAALWSSTDDQGRPLDDGSLEYEIAEEALAVFRKDCERFLQQADALTCDESDSDLAHDFWLTRNGHGAGFWDGDYPKELGEKLTDISKTFGECDLYVGDDKRVYAR